MGRPNPRQNPARAFEASRASAAALRPCAPTSQPYAPAQVYRCPCAASVTLAPLAPLPGDWQTVVIAARKGRPERIAYRCPRCVRRQLVLTLLADDIALHAIAIRDARRLAAWCLRNDLDARGICTVVRRLQAERGALAWARLVERCELGGGE